MTFDQKLYSIFSELNQLHFGGLLPLIEIKFSGRLKTTGGQYFRRPKRFIQISTRYLEMESAWKEIRDTLGHEMVHYWLDFRSRPCGHTAEFNRKLRSCGFQRYSRLHPVNARYLYMCGECGLKYFRRKKGIWSCGPCSGRVFNPLYKLRLVLETSGSSTTL